ncbi:Androgen-induced protein 1 protein [Bulinus truncatus]|nr:Androgen-induced protein 1 protein [Bulinus truncatus]
MTFAVLAFHSIAFIIDLYALYFDLFHLEIGSGGTGGKYKFLTVWNITFQCLYFGLCVVADITNSEGGLSNPNSRGKLLRWRDYVHAAVAFPVGMFVVVTFWVLFAVDRQLVYPEHLDKIIPPFINHVLHTTVMPFIIIDKCLVYHHHPSRWQGLAGTVGVSGCYLVWILCIAYLDNFWVYPVLEVLESHQKAIFIFVCLMFFASQYILGESLTKFFWRKHEAKSKKKI